MKLFSKSEDNILQSKGYTLGGTLGQGSYATVKSAIWKKDAATDPENVAVKIIHLLEVQEDFKKKFLKRELDIARILDHPNIIKTIEVIEVKDRVYIPIELASKGDLLGYIQLRGPLQEQIAAKFFSEMCHGIQYLHANNVVHRDLKCENVLLNTKNVAKIADFGFARKQKSGELSETYCGSAAYAAPELLRGMPYVGTMADIWSLGVIMFTMACAMMPFRDGNMKTLMMDQKRPLSFPKRMGNSLSPSIKELMQGMLTSDVCSRYTLNQVMDHAWNKELAAKEEKQERQTEENTYNHNEKAE